MPQIKAEESPLPPHPKTGFILPHINIKDRLELELVTDSGQKCLLWSARQVITQDEINEQASHLLTAEQAGRHLMLDVYLHPPPRRGRPFQEPVGRVSRSGGDTTQRWR